MNKSLRNRFTLALAIALTAPGFGRTPSGEIPQPDRELTVWVLNLAQVPEDELARAKDQASGIFRRAGVGIAWVDCPVSAGQLRNGRACRQLPGPTALTVHIRPRSSAPPNQSAKYGYGLLPKKGGFGFYAVVYADGADHLAKGQDSILRMTRPMILGLLMAHEMGHLLLATQKHSISGVMKFPWSADDLTQAACGSLGFTPKQAKRMRAQVRDRIRAEEAAGTANLRTPK